MVVDLLAAPLGETSAGEAPLVRAAAAGDAAAFDELVRRHWAELVRLARVVLASDLEAEDLAQEALAHAWRRLGGLRDPARFAPWLRRSLVRRGIRWARKRRSQRALLAPDAREPVAATAPAPSAGLDAAALLAALTPRQRAAFFLTEVEGFTVAEAARRLGTAEATLRVHRLLGRRRLRALLTGGTP